MHPLPKALKVTFSHLKNGDPFLLENPMFRCYINFREGINFRVCQCIKGILFYLVGVKIKHQKQHKASKKSRRVCQTSSCICQTSSCICQTSSCICTISGDGDPFFEHLRAAAMLTSTQQIFLLCRQILEPSDHIS